MVYKVMWSGMSGPREREFANKAAAVEFSRDLKRFYCAVTIVGPNGAHYPQ